LPKKIVRGILACPIATIGCMEMSICTFLGNRGLLSKDNQIRHQKFVRWWYINCIGFVKQKHEGMVNGNSITFHLKNNVWIDYELAGEYERMVKSIHLRRHLQEQYAYGRYRQLHQNGWMSSLPLMVLLKVVRALSPTVVERKITLLI